MCTFRRCRCEASDNSSLHVVDNGVTTVACTPSNYSSPYVRSYRPHSWLLDILFVVRLFPSIQIDILFLNFVRVGGHHYHQITLKDNLWHLQQLATRRGTSLMSDLCRITLINFNAKMMCERCLFLINIVKILSIYSRCYLWLPLHVDGIISKKNHTVCF